jgi:MFS family permease
MVGMLMGGILLGWLGDRYGRLRTLLFSILLYSISNFMNAWVTDVSQYSVLRFLAGFGLAGELGLAVTFVSEKLHSHVRGLGASLIGLAGFSGAIVSVLVSSQLDWRLAYGLGGFLGLLLLFTRIRTSESTLFKKNPTRARFPFSTWGVTSFRKLLECTLVGGPVWFAAGLFSYFAPELGRALQMKGEVLASTAILWAYVGSLVGDTLAGAFSQLLRSRKRALGMFLVLGSLLTLSFTTVLEGRPAYWFYAWNTLMGFVNGYWALFVTMTSERFGTQERALATTSIPNLVRASVTPMLWLLSVLQTWGKPYASAVMAVGILTFCLAWIGWLRTPETFHRDLDFLE